ncbi:hypothetical protein IGI04_035675 [Brassica rapa subsp. trilocularis]|uniref:Uncharacterized protein n=1 Tax=Brassica rapa subsp. trilocularis TaxID=1813537 RepID=A0ABQ7LF18_BRACM|nr:hypothetical protein IGI04_035675 [Brassica rapa subsp. trilocularis]
MAMYRAWKQELSRIVFLLQCPLGFTADLGFLDFTLFPTGISSFVTCLSMASSYPSVWCLTYLGFDPFSSMRSTRGRTIDRCASSAVDRHQEMPRQMKINIDRCTQVPSIDVETLDKRHFGSSGLEAQVQAKLRKCPNEFLT